MSSLMYTFLILRWQVKNWVNWTTELDVKYEGDINHSAHHLQGSLHVPA